MSNLDFLEHYKSPMLFTNTGFAINTLFTKKYFVMNKLKIDKYDWSEEDAKMFSDWLTPMLHFDPEKRATAHECLKHPFLKDIS